MVDRAGFEPATPALQMRCSTAELTARVVLPSCTVWFTLSSETSEKSVRSFSTENKNTWMKKPVAEVRHRSCVVWKERVAGTT